MILLCLMALPVSAEPWLKYGRSGGIAGMFMTLTISSEGRVEYQDKQTPIKTATLSEAEMKALREAVPNPFPHSKREGLVVPDGINSELQVGQDKAEWGTGTPTPHALYPLLEQLEKVRSKFPD